MAVALAALAAGCKAHSPLPDDGEGDGVAPVHLRAGAARVVITPEIRDTWQDVNGDGVYEPELGDKAVDANGDGKIDFTFLAGYGSPRPATGVADDLLASALVLESGGRRYALVGVDIMGLPYHDIRPVMETARRSLGIAGMVVCASHSHASPDAFGLWGLSSTRSGRDDRYVERVRSGILEALTRACDDLAPAEYQAWQTNDPNGIVDGRQPVVVDDALTLLHVATHGGGRTIATLVNWSNHMDLMGEASTLVSSDIAHTIRKGLEEGVTLPDGEKFAGLGGVAIFTAGSIGGQIEPQPGSSWRTETSDQPSRDGDRETRRMGYDVAAACHRLMRSGRRWSGGNEVLWRSREFPIEITNARFVAAQKAGVLPTFDQPGALVSTVSALRLGPLELVAVPGEIYPELVIGGIESPAGADFPGEPVETPPIKAMMSGPVKVVLGLANDEIGYVIPRTQWDEQPPFTYGQSEAPYGEINSLGPHAAAAIHREVKAALRDLHARDP
ncbi:MAG: hypothetical protein HY719_06550 [Planctomycetes bacterium]|nr:hypothetical protein [Planctomycetota bacterium]